MPASQLKQCVIAAVVLSLVLGGCARGNVRSGTTPTNEHPVATVFPTLGPRGDFPDGIAVTGPRGAIASVPWLHYEAGLRFAKSDPSAYVGRMNLQPYVQISNTGRLPAEIHLRGCPVSLRMYPEPYHEELPAWDGARFRDRAGGCAQEDFTVAIEPGASYEVADDIDPVNVFDDSVPEGQYRFSVVFTHADRPPMQLGIWRTFASRASGGLVFTTETRMVDVAPRKLEVVVTTTNVADETFRLEYDPCAVRLRAHKRSDRIDEPVWDELRRGCEDQLLITELAPAESARPDAFRRGVNEPEILGESRQDGQYVFTATVTVNGVSTDVPASQLHLVRAQVPLSAERTVGGFRYEAAPTEYSGPSGSITSAVIVTDVDGSRSTAMARCPVLLYAFRDRAMRDIAFTGAEPDWRPQEEGCAVEFENRPFQPDGTIRLEATISLPELRQIAGAGRYYFVAVIPASETRIGGAVVLSAGEADIPE